MTRDSLSYRLARAICQADSKVVGAGVIECAKNRLFDTLGVIFNGLDHPAARVVLATQYTSGGPCTIIARNRSASPGDAAFVNGVTSHVTLQEDLGGGGHPGTYIVPVALAVGEDCRSSGLDVLVAIILGYEVADRFQRAAPEGFYERGFRIVPAIGVFGAATTAGVLMRLSPAELSAALDVAANMAGGLYQSFADGTMEGYLHAGLAARSGILAACLARAGAMTSDNALDGEFGFFRTFGGGAADSDALTAPLVETNLAVLRALSKPFPACALNQDTMLMIRALRPARLRADDITGLVIRRPASGINSLGAPGVALEPPYRNMLQAQMSAKFTAIATLLGRPVEELPFFRDSFSDPEIERVARRTHFDVSPDGHCVLEVRLRNSDPIIMTTAGTNGLSWAQDRVRQRFEAFAEPYLNNEVQSASELIAGLDNAERIGELTRLLN